MVGCQPESENGYHRTFHAVERAFSYLIDARCFSGEMDISGIGMRGGVDSMPSFKRFVQTRRIPCYGWKLYQHHGSTGV